MAIVISGTGIDMGGNPVSNASQIDSVLMNENGASVATETQVGTANSTLVKTALNATGAAPIYASRAWVSFKGTGAVTINKGGNTSSITDNAVGDYTMNFTTAMPDALYALAGSAIVDATEIADVIAIKLATASTYANKTTSSVTFRVGNNNADGAMDAFDINVFIID